MSTIKNNTRGFTLIELLVVITIIGILATLGVSQFTTQLQKTRDAKRITSLEQIKGAIETYNLDNTKFPPQATFTGVITTYLPVIPVDPKTTQTCAKKGLAVATKCDYAYQVGNDANDIEDNAFELSAGFESVTNIDVHAANTKDKGNCADRLEIGTAYSEAVGGKVGTDLAAKCVDTDNGIYIN